MNPIPRIEAELPRATSRSWFEERLKETVTYAKELEKQIEAYEQQEQYLLERLKIAEGVNERVSQPTRTSIQRCI